MNLDESGQSDLPNGDPEYWLGISDTLDRNPLAVMTRHIVLHSITASSIPQRFVLWLASVFLKLGGWRTIPKILMLISGAMAVYYINRYGLHAKFDSLACQAILVWLTMIWVGLPVFDFLVLAFVPVARSAYPSSVKRRFGLFVIVFVLIKCLQLLPINVVIVTIDLINIDALLIAAVGVFYSRETVRLPWIVALLIVYVIALVYGLGWVRADLPFDVFDRQSTEQFLAWSHAMLEKDLVQPSIIRFLGFAQEQFVLRFLFVAGSFAIAFFALVIPNYGRPLTRLGSALVASMVFMAFAIAIWSTRAGTVLSIKPLSPTVSLQAVENSQLEWADEILRNEVELTGLGFSRIGSFVVNELDLGILVLVDEATTTVATLYKLSDRPIVELSSVDANGEFYMCTTLPDIGTPNPPWKTIIHNENATMDQLVDQQQAFLAGTNVWQTIATKQFVELFQEQYKRDMDWHVQRGGPNDGELRKQLKFEGEKYIDYGLPLMRQIWNETISKR